MQERRRLKNLFLFPESQVRYGILFLTLATFTHVALTIGALKIYSVWGTEEGDGGGFPIWIGVVAMALVYFVLQAFAFVLGILMSHKLFGPLVALRNFTRELKNGNYSGKVVLRTQDEPMLRELGDDLNAIAEVLAKTNRP